MADYDLILRGGTVHDGVAPAGSKPSFELRSPALAEVVRDINKYSNNVMARQVFLTLSGDLTKEPASAARSAQTIREWLSRKGIAAPELVLENGSGLSRTERITPEQLAAVLKVANQSRWAHRGHTPSRQRTWCLPERRAMSERVICCRRCSRKMTGSSVGRHVDRHCRQPTERRLMICSQ